MYLCLVLCPIGYLAPYCKDADNTWYFALNFAAAHDLVLGRDIAWTWGPLFYLFFPFDIGNNLVRAMAFQAGLWILVVVVLRDLFFRDGFPLRNLALFSVLIGLSTFDYHQLRYPGNLPLYPALILLVHFRLRGGIMRYIASLAILGLMLLFQIFGTLILLGALAGLVVDSAFGNRHTSRTYIALAMIVPVTIAVVACRLALGSFQAVATYIRCNLELSRGYSFAMSASGARVELVAAFEGIALFVAALSLLMICNRDQARFFGLVFALPLVMNLKHGFVRQDAGHVAVFFCFLAMIFAMLILAIPLNEQVTRLRLIALLLLFAILWQDYAPGKYVKSTIASVFGLDAVSQLWNASRFTHLRQSLGTEGQENCADTRVEPEIKSIVGREPIAFLSNVYSNALMDDLNLVLLPVLQRYAAGDTPYLDQMVGTWIDQKGPRFLIFDGLTIDFRHPWTETPATWREVYRWYDARMLGSHNLLLERRAAPRFNRFEIIAHQTIRFGAHLAMPQSPDRIFWTMQCSLSTTGRLRALLARVPPVMMDVNTTDGRTRTFRVLPSVLGAPSLSRYLPSSLTEFAEIFRGRDDPDFSVANLEFKSLGQSAYQQDCKVEFLRALP
jgi:hypothetical protein